MDIKDKSARSKNMAAIRSRDTKPEVYFRKLLFSRGYRYRKNIAKVIGHPDIFLKKYNTAIFVNGCFWHRHRDCKYAYQPKSREDFWAEKFRKNIERDLTVREQLYARRIKCLIVWECTIRKMQKSKECEEEVIQATEKFLQSSELYLEI